MKDDNLFLTENRREVLRGESTWTDASISNEKSRIRKRARLALEELTEVARSSEIDNEDVFHPDDVQAFILSLIEPGGLTTVGYEHTTDRYREALISRLATSVVKADHSDTDE